MILADPAFCDNPLYHYRCDHDGDYTLSTVRYQSEGEEDETVILENDSKV